MVQAIRHEGRPVTVDEFLRLSLPEGKAELVRGELRMSPPAGGRHGRTGTNLILLLGLHVLKHGLGEVFGDGTGYELMQIPHTVRVPDGSFVREDRLPSEIGPGPLRLAPDLAIEVLSPSETGSDLEERLHDYQLAGTPLIWVVDPENRNIMIVAKDAPIRWLEIGDVLDGGEVVHGFSCNVSEIFRRVAP